uniref:Uncharacterized protein n=1 Tax=Rhizophora mucronata TaxID=61149 RepID=A0A2P2QG12_RHIMU
MPEEKRFGKKNGQKKQQDSV